MCARAIGAGERGYSEVDALGSAARRNTSLLFDISLAASHDLLSFDATLHPSCH